MIISGDCKNFDSEYIDLAFKTFPPNSVVLGVETHPGVEGNFSASKMISKINNPGTNSVSKLSS